MSITNCQFLLNNTEALSSTLINILINEKDPLIAYQIAFDLYDNQNPSYLRKIISEINKINEVKHVPEDQLNPLLNIRGPICLCRKERQASHLCRLQRRCLQIATIV